MFTYNVNLLLNIYDNILLTNIFENALLFLRLTSQELIAAETDKIYHNIT